MIKTAKILHFYKIRLYIVVGYFTEDIIFMGLTLPFSFRRRGWGMRSKPDLSPAFSPPFPWERREIV
jgi:hypothetical protein